MHATLLIYPAMSGQSGRFAVHRPELESVVRGVPGLVSFHLLVTAEDVAVSVIGRDRATCEECVHRLAGWMGQHLPDLASRSALTVGGEVIAEVTENEARR